MLFLDEAIKNRRSIRKFSKKPVKDGDVLEIIRAGCAAPSAKNRQPWQFIVLTKDEAHRIADAMKEWAKSNPLGKGTVVSSASIIQCAPVVIAVCSPAVKSCPRSDYISIGACLENMCLKAVDAGLGSLIVCDVDCVAEEAKKILGTKDEVTALFLTGYAAAAAKAPSRKPLVQKVRGLDLARLKFSSPDNLPEAYIGDKKFAFVSYSHADSDVVINDITEFKRHGIVLWYDSSVIYGEKWDDKALNIIKNPGCAVVLLYVSETSLRSQAVAREIKTAKEYGKRVVNIHIGDMPLNDYCREKTGCVAELLDESEKFISRSVIPEINDATEAVAEVCKNAGVIEKSGVYDNFEYEVTRGGIRITAYNGTSETVVVPSRISGMAVIEIGHNSISLNACIKKIVLPSGVSAIGDGAFSGNANLKDIILPSSIEEIGVAAFRDCISLERISLPPCIKILREATFRGCKMLKECVVPDGVAELGEAVFNGCISLEKVVLPESVKKMTEGGFFGCVKLKDIAIPEDIEGLEIQSFDTCPEVRVTAGGFRYENGKGFALNKD